MNKNNIQYWSERALLKEERHKRKGDKLISNLKKEYNTAYKEIDKQLNDWYKKYADENSISINQAKAKLTKLEYKRWQQDMEDFIKKSKSLDPRYEKELRERYINSRVSKLESIQNQVSMQLEILAKSQDIETLKHLQNTYKSSFYETLFDAYKAGLGVRFDILDESLVESICLTPWTGKSFSERIWRNNKKLIQEVRSILSQGVIQGIDINQMSRKLSGRMGAALHRGKTLIRTETNFILNQATANGYETAGLDEYQFLATLDNRTSTICQRLDNKIFKVKDRMVGVNYPPMHPNCRSTTIPYFREDEGLLNEKRFARDKDGKGMYISADMNYKKWYNEYIKDKPSYNGAWEKEKNLVIPTNIIKERHSPTVKGEPNSVIQIETKNQINRDFYDSNGWLTKQIHGGPHGNPKMHPFGKKGEHAHYWIYEEKEGKYIVKNRNPSEIKDNDYEENKDILK
jgi:SPP1 gp7 family putative phage head morphogenesis protein